ncbi:MAG: hypothetical protein H0T11_06925 [Chthoniobacterales bacterium]|nr:hypothetical protein [Chthoniobacterales bacterium]
MANDLPTSNLDVAATIMHILGLKPAEPLDGRVMSEVMTEGNGSSATAKAETLEALRDLPGGRWQQHLRLSKIESSVYLDEGDGAFTPSPDAE